MIISASRRTDIPAFYSSWFMDRIREEKVLVKNPFNPSQKKTISLRPEGVDAIVFWTRNAAPFIQYAHARASSILSKTKEKTDDDVDASLLTHDSERLLIKHLARFPLVVEAACRGCRPHLIASYVYDTASQFNQFYRDCPVLPEKNKKLRHARLGLVDATKTVLCNGLDLLGIVAPEEM